jgi:hypothetical protein
MSEALNDDAVNDAVIELREAAKKAAAAIEPLLRWSMQLESDPATAVRGMRKALGSLSCSNPILLLMAEKALGTIAPEAVIDSAASRRERAKGKLEYELREEIEAELLKRCGLTYRDQHLETPDDRTSREQIMEIAWRLFKGPVSRFGRARPSEPDNVVAVDFGSLGGAKNEPAGGSDLSA